MKEDQFFAQMKVWRSWTNEFLRSVPEEIADQIPLSVIVQGKGDKREHEKSETTKIYAQHSGKLRQNFYCNYF
jgi:hypothetical protein